MKYRVIIETYGERDELCSRVEATRVSRKEKAPTGLEYCKALGCAIGSVVIQTCFDSDEVSEHAAEQQSIDLVTKIRILTTKRALSHGLDIIL